MTSEVQSVAEEPRPIVNIAIVTYHPDGTVTTEQWGNCNLCAAFLRHVLGKPATSTIGDHERITTAMEESGLVILEREHNDSGA